MSFSLSPQHYLGIIIGFGLLFLLATHASLVEAARQADTPYSQCITEYGDLVDNDDWSQAISMALQEAKSGSVLYFPQDYYRISQPLIIDKDITIQLEAGTSIVSESSKLFIITQGDNITIEGIGGKAYLSASSEVFYLNTLWPGTKPNLELRRLQLSGTYVVFGDKERQLASLTLIDNVLIASRIHINIENFTIGKVHIERNHFTTKTGYAYAGINIRGDIPNGVLVLNNHIENVEAKGMDIRGVAFLVPEALESIPMAIIENNTIIGGGRVPLLEQYIAGIWVNGKQIKITGNIIRDLNRGVPVPGADYGQHIPLEDGSYFTGIMMDHQGSQRRVAGAAIYTKCRNAIVSDNICINSGWRAVIEIKGADDYAIVSNNVCDGSALSIVGSIGMETQGNRSLWTGNIIYNMPYIAMKFGPGYENTVINNVFHNAKQGITGLYSRNFSEEVVAFNRFINVDEPLAGTVQAGNVQFYDLNTLTVQDERLLPEPGPQYRGKIAVVQSARGDKVFIALYNGTKHIWQQIN